MNEIVDRRKAKFERYKDLREAGALWQVTEAAAEEEAEEAAPETVEIAEAEDVNESLNKRKEYTVRDRISDIADSGSFQEFSYDFLDIDPIDFPGYLDKKHILQIELKEAEAVVAGLCTIAGFTVVIAVMNKAFLMGSMGAELGERIALAAETALKKRLPLIIFAASGGARMQEGIISLMQMAKTAAVIKKYKDAGGLYIAVLTHPTTGGVSASFASLGDITLAEPGALIGFAGPRVIEQTIGTQLPLGFQRAEFLEEHGFVDGVVAREDMKDTLVKILSLHLRKGF